MEVSRSWRTDLWNLGLTLGWFLEPLPLACDPKTRGKQRRWVGKRRRKYRRYKGKQRKHMDNELEWGIQLGGTHVAHWLPWHDPGGERCQLPASQENAQPKIPLVTLTHSLLLQMTNPHNQRSPGQRKSTSRWSTQPLFIYSALLSSVTRHSSETLPGHWLRGGSDACRRRDLCTRKGDTSTRGISVQKQRKHGDYPPEVSLLASPRESHGVKWQ